MNDLRSPLEDRPYRPATPSFGQQQTLNVNQSAFAAKFNQLRQHRFFPLGSVIVAVLIFGGLISYAYNQGSQSGVNATTPVVQASNQDYKSKPTNPGGMDVPFQDAVVFDQLQSKQANAQPSDKVESLLPGTETPAASTTAQTAANTAPTTNNATTNASTSTDTTAPTANATATAPSGNTVSTPSTDNKASATTAVQQNTTAPTTNVATTQSQTTTKSTNTASVAKKLASVAPASTSPTAKISSGTYRIQLGAFHDQAAAKTAWTKMKNQFSSALSKVTPAYPVANTAKGTFYRVQGVNLSKASAEQICGQINAAKSGSCIVTK